MVCFDCSSTISSANLRISSARSRQCFGSFVKDAGIVQITSRCRASPFPSKAPTPEYPALGSLQLCPPRGGSLERIPMNRVSDSEAEGCGWLTRVAHPAADTIVLVADTNTTAPRWRFSVTSNACGHADEHRRLNRPSRRVTAGGFSKLRPAHQRTGASCRDRNGTGAGLRAEVGACCTGAAFGCAEGAELILSEISCSAAFSSAMSLAMCC